jgi:H+/gluconate symporter-like permease
MWKTFLIRISVLAIPVYVVAAIVWKFVLAQSWLYSLAGVPLALLLGGIISCATMSPNAPPTAARGNRHKQPPR